MGSPFLGNFGCVRNKDFTINSLPKKPSIVLAFAGDSTITKLFILIQFNTLIKECKEIKNIVD